MGKDAKGLLSCEVSRDKTLLQLSDLDMVVDNRSDWDITSDVA